MTAVNCPMCELRLATRKERGWHLNDEHRHPLHGPAPGAAAGDGVAPAGGR